MPAEARVRERVYEVLEVAGPGDRTSRLFDLAITVLIVLSTISVVLETVPGLLDPVSGAVRLIEYLTVTVFTVEYLLRLWSVTADPRYRRPLLGRVRWALTPLAIVDLLAVLPFYLPFVAADLRVLRVLRLFRFVRVLKAGRYSDSAKTLLAVLEQKKADLFSALAITGSLVLVAATLMYYAEREAQPERYESIPMAIWWVIATLGGNADVLPRTFAGRVLASVVSILGVGLFALPAGILASGFSSELDRQARAGARPDVDAEREVGEDETPR